MISSMEKRIQPPVTGSRKPMRKSFWAQSQRFFELRPSITLPICPAVKKCLLLAGWKMSIKSFENAAVLFLMSIVIRVPPVD